MRLRAGLAACAKDGTILDMNQIFCFNEGRVRLLM